MNYVAWSIVALLGYTLFAPLVSLATNDVPSTVVATVSNAILLLAAIGVVLVSGEPIAPHLRSESAVYMYAAGLTLAVGILSYYHALSLGPVSVVVPIYGMFIVTSSLVGIAFLDESLSVQKSLGILFAILAIVLVATEG